MEATKQILDKYLGKFMSRKLMSLGLATGLFWVDKLSSDQWLMMAIAYVGVQGFQDFALKWKGPNAISE